MKHNTRVPITRRFFLRGVGLLSATAALAACALQGENGQQSTTAATPLLAIIHTNDTHGHDVEVQTTDDAAGNFSMAAVPALKAEWEAKGYEVLVVDAGDATQGVPLVDTSYGEAAMAFMNSCGYDLMTVGNHEFDWGMEKLRANEELATFPFLSANVTRKDDGSLCFNENKVCELADGTKVGFFGLTTPATMTTCAPKNVANLTFPQGEDLYACAQKQVDALRGEGCSLVVCVGHLGNDEAYKESGSKAVLKNVKGIDLFIDGHDHQLVEEEVEGTLLVETGSYMQNIGLVVIDNGVPTNESVAYGSFEGIDKATQAIIDQENERVQDELGVVLGQTAYFLDGERNPGVRTQETNLGDFCADAFRWTASQELGKAVDAGLANGGGIRASIATGDISLMTIKTVLPYSNNLAVINVTGAQLLEALEAACQGIGQDSLLGAFPQVSGITFTLDASVPFEEGPKYPDSTMASPAAIGARITIEDVGGRGFDESETYSVATISFLCEGGDTYYAFKVASDAEEPVTFGFDYEALSSYLVSACNHVVPEEYAGPQGRITIIGL